MKTVKINSSYLHILKGMDMTILVTGSTGAIGSQIVRQLAAQRASVRALVRNPGAARLPAGVTVAHGDMTDVESMRAALDGIDTLFLLNAVTPDEVTQALITLSLAGDAGIQRIVYFSVLNSEPFTDVPHFTGKYTVERMIEQFDLGATILRPAYFMQNDVSLKEALLGHGIYPMPLGDVGIAMVDTRDIADIAVSALLERERATSRLPRQTIELVGPHVLTGNAIAQIWSEALGKPIVYGGNDLDAFEARFKTFAPGWMARDMRLMMGRFQKDGMVASKQAVERMSALLGRPPRSYRDFAFDMAQSWKDG